VVEARVDDIIDFAEIGDFIDAPVRTYSSGMSTRLGFAIASHVDPDILAVDEVLAVGDTAFQEKCRLRIQEFQQQGTTILLVAHSMQAIKESCSRVIWLDKGCLMQDGAPDEVASAYLDYTTRQTP
jgi:lipopolysaccharide transport system ATP-binding protein